jgi:hypothetical protein
MDTPLIKKEVKEELTQVSYGQQQSASGGAVESAAASVPAVLNTDLIPRTTDTSVKCAIQPQRLMVSSHSEPRKEAEPENSTGKDDEQSSSYRTEAAAQTKSCLEQGQWRRLSGKCRGFQKSTAAGEWDPWRDDTTPARLSSPLKDKDAPTSEGESIPAKGDNTPTEATVDESNPQKGDNTSKREGILRGAEKGV